MELVTIPEAAAMLRVSSVTVRRFIAAGELPAVRVGRLVRVERREAEGLVKPYRPRLRARRYRKHPRPFSFEDSLWNLVGIAGDHDGPTDVASDKYKYLTEDYLNHLSDNGSV